MKFYEFQKKMQKSLFSIQEAKIVSGDPQGMTLKLQLHQWEKKGLLVRLKRGLYGFPEERPEPIHMAKVLYSPAYVSLEYALHFYGLIPDVVFSMTLVTPKTTRTFHTPYGQFIYHKMRQDLFWGYDPTTLMGEREKVIADYCYLRSGQLKPESQFWETLRWQNLQEVNFKELFSIAEKFDSKKVVALVQSLQNYTETQHGKN